MPDLSLTLSTPEGTKEVPIDLGRLTLGRGDVDHRIEDEGLSRLHATIYNEAGRVWIVDENSSNGTFVNGSRVPPQGVPLSAGDVIKIGNRTHITVSACRTPAINDAFNGESRAEKGESTVPGWVMSLLPVVIIACALAVVSVSAVVIGFKILTPNSRQAEVVELDETDKRAERPSASQKSPGSPSPAQANKEIPNELATETEKAQPNATPAAKLYLAMSETERREYLGDRAMRIAQVIGNRSSDPIPAEALEKIKGFVDGYAKRINTKPLGGCRFGDNLQVTFERASANAPFIVRAFNEKGIDPRIGIYLAMIESEHCVCLQSPTGPLGMFQFTKATGELHGLRTVRGASPSNPDERCEPEPSAKAAASYMKALTGRYGTGPASVPLAIGSYNSGEGGLSSNLVKALESNTGLPRDFWTLIAKGDILSKQFQAENFKYVPKFFAAAIIGENPADFGLRLNPISSYSK